MRRWMLGGLAGPVLFTLVWLIEGTLRPGYDPMRNWISELALTGRGWIQIAAFLACAVAIIGFADSLRRTFPAGPGSVWGPRLVAVHGAALFAAGIFSSDPGLGYPPGSDPAVTWHGILHSVAGPIAFFSLAGAALVYARRFAKAYCIASGTLVVLFWVVAGVLAGLDYGGTWSPAPSGLAERLSILTGYVWMVWLAWKARDAAGRTGADEHRNRRSR
ncbi:DUF998 domain-containing protein [Sphaerisporangium dianthi]|uniref:DUF998 domain-containing protein n=1 Tax=Sphaerisporangium dianthi TaxID=1436120 RepID=A0ABV9CA19_9ACTN